ncbi:VHS domain protein [Ancylostoma ceylanicum]|uniref:VHS domain protein n=1 Tax=Ancylostoma ceylanicum TaxID=53326 RepID=A0A0D6LRI2_9BILA|nr:VHS domain protein [Ancylostoma ceylanicum]
MTSLLQMGIFGDSSSPFDECIEKVTAEHLTTENWAMILDVCDKVNSDPRAPKNAILSIRKRLNHRDPHVVLLALSVLDSCWSNCGPAFRKEVSSASFISELQSKAVHSLPRTSYDIWLIPEYTSNRRENKDDDPKEEEDALARAIALSLQESDKNTKTSKIYQSLNSTAYTSANGTSNKTSERTVRALYDFEAAEDNELSFVSGDLITVTDDSNPNWWCGRIGVQQGLFPSSFVTSDLSEVKPETMSTAAAAPAPAVTTIDESVLLRCIQMLEDCDPTGDTPDPPELAKVEQASRAQGPLINARLAAIDSQVNALSQVDMAIRDVLALYDQAVQQAHYQASVYQAQAPVVNPAVAMPAQTAGISSNFRTIHEFNGLLVARETPFDPNKLMMKTAYQTSYANVPAQTLPVSNVPVRQDGQAPYAPVAQYAPVPQPAYQQPQIQPEWNQQAVQHPAPVQHPAQNY